MLSNYSFVSIVSKFSHFISIIKENKFRIKAQTITINQPGKRMLNWKIKAKIKILWKNHWVSKRLRSKLMLVYSLALKKVTTVIQKTIKLTNHSVNNFSILLWFLTNLQNIRSPIFHCSQQMVLKEMLVFSHKSRLNINFTNKEGVKT